MAIDDKYFLEFSLTQAQCAKNCAHKLQKNIFFHSSFSKDGTMEDFSLNQDLVKKKHVQKFAKKGAACKLFSFLL